MSLRKKLFPLLALVAGLLTGCDMFEAHPYDGKVSGERDINAKNIERIQTKLAGCKEFRFAMISDTQRWYDETVDAVNAINARGDIDFVVHGGDQSDFGATHEFEMQRDILNKLSMPYVIVLGNHDCLGTGEDTYKAIYGPTNFAFTAGNVRFLCLNTNALEYDYSEPVPDFTFLDNEAATVPEGVEKTIALMHVQPGNLIFNNNVAKLFQYCLWQFPSPQFCLYGHDHDLRVEDLFDDGLLYYQCPNIQKRIYLVFTIHPGDNDYDYEVVEF
jgi:3',5'-cyclic AMP phosphodiesterase CpdA